MDHSPSTNGLFEALGTIPEESQQTNSKNIIEDHKEIVINVQTESQLSVATDFSTNVKSGIE